MLFIASVWKRGPPDPVEAPGTGACGEVIAWWVSGKRIGALPHLWKHQRHAGFGTAALQEAHAGLEVVEAAGQGAHGPGQRTGKLSQWMGTTRRAPVASTTSRQYASRNSSDWLPSTPIPR